MNKLTLSADDDIIRSAKRIAADHNTSVSALFTRFVQTMVRREWVDKPIGPIARKASGLVSLPDDRTDDDLLSDALADRHGDM
jgi:hypothetical protein